MEQPLIQIYAIFHLNLAYSSLEDYQRSEVIQQCYWPLFRLARKHDLPFGFEASGYTLEVLSAEDSQCFQELRWLVTEGSCEFIGSGYAQIIGPLVPAEVNRKNLVIGNAVYGELLGIHPRLAFVNEQAYSAGMVQHYLEAGYEAIVMDWDNPARYHPEWDPEWRYYPQYACDQRGNQIAIIWNSSLAFQQFQRYVYGECLPEEYLRYLSRHVAGHGRSFALYGNDVEIFDFRPGRYATEAPLRGKHEWQRIREVFEALSADSRFRIIPPHQVLDRLSEPQAGHHLHLESLHQPILVKKQDKYNVTRWAVTGRDDSAINAACWRAFEALSDRLASTDDWKELCYLWGSDFRTHLTERRWIAYRQRLDAFLARLGCSSSPRGQCTPLSRDSLGYAESSRTEFQIERQGHYLVLESPSIGLRLNCRRGLAIDALWLKDFAPQPVLGTLPHGYYDNIAMGADFYSGHVVCEFPGQPKVTDLGPVDPVIGHDDRHGQISIRGEVETRLGPVRKTIFVTADGRITIHYVLNWRIWPMGSLRVAAITLNPEVFDQDSLFVETTNGGSHPERFSLANSVIDHGQSISSLVSASTALAMTTGTLLVGDYHRTIEIRTDQAQSYVVALVTYYPVGRSYFCRVSFSARECDETTRTLDCGVTARRFSFTISPHSSSTTALSQFETSAIVPVGAARTD